MLLIRSVLATVLMFAFSFAHADEGLKLQAQDLEDYLSPTELVREFGLNPDGVMWKASFENPRLYIIVDKAERGTSRTAQTLEAVLDGQSLYKFKVSTAKEARVTTPDGTSYFATTPEGEFKIYSRDRYHKSNKWNGAEMNFAQFFIGGIAMHATTEMHFDAIGSRDSGGCVRLMPKNAEKMWDLVDQVGVNDTKVIVYDGSSERRPNFINQSPVIDDRPSYPQSSYQPPQYPQYPQYPQPQPPQPRYQPPQPRYQPPQGRPTPPPRPPPGQRDTYPYCAPGYWCPYDT